MKDRLRNKTIRAAALMLAAAIFVLSFSVYVNVTASSGGTAGSPLNVISGDPAVLAGLSFNLWSNRPCNYDNYFFTDNKDDFVKMTHVRRDTVSFDETGRPSVKSYVQVYAGAYEIDYAYDSEVGLLGLTKELELTLWRNNNNNDDVATIPGFQIDHRIKNVMQDDKDVYRTFSNRLYHYTFYEIDGTEYYVFMKEDVDAVIRDVYFQMNNGEGDYEARYNRESSYDRFPEWRAYSFTPGLFRADGETVENILPIKASSGGADVVYCSLVYIPKTKCLALSAVEQYCYYTETGWCYDNYVYVYIYHLETGASEKHFIISYSTSDSRILRRLCVNDNYLTVIVEEEATCIETHKTEESVTLNHISMDATGESFAYYYRTGDICFASKDDLLYVMGFAYYYGGADDPFPRYGVNIRVLSENDIVFSGEMTIWQGTPPSTITLSDELLFETQVGLVRGYVDGFK